MTPFVNGVEMMDVLDSVFNHQADTIIAENVTHRKPADAGRNKNRTKDLKNIWTSN